MTIKLTREEAIRTLRKVQREVVRGSYIDEVYEMAIDALKHERTDEWCTDCKEYDKEKNCCPRFNRVIRGAMKREPSEDGTLEVKVEDATKVGRVLISDDKHRGGLYYPDEDELQGDLISRQDAIETVGDWMVKEFGYLDLNRGERLIDALEARPSADRPRGEWIHTPNGTDRDFVWWTCSECGHKIFSETEKDRIEFHAYCGRCGADMRSE